MPAPAAAAGIYILQTYDFTEPHGYWPNTWLNYNQLKKKKRENPRDVSVRDWGE